MFTPLGMKYQWAKKKNNNNNNCHYGKYGIRLHNLGELYVITATVTISQ